VEGIASASGACSTETGGGANFARAAGTAGAATSRRGGRRGCKTWRRAPSGGGGAQLGDPGADLRRLLRGRGEQLERDPPPGKLFGGVAAPAGRRRRRGQMPELNRMDQTMAEGAGEERRRHLGAAGTGHPGRIGAAESASVTEP